MTPIVAFFNNKSGVGKTSLVYHLASMYAELGTRVLAADLDPQANLTAAFIDEAGLEKYWLQPAGGTVFDAIRPLTEGTGTIEDPHVATIEPNLDALVGTLRLADLETDLAQEWPSCADSKPRAFRVIAAFWTVMQRAAELCGAEVILLDLGPSLGAINRSALSAADHVVVPLAADLFSLTGLTNLGPRLRTWRREWQERVTKNTEPTLPLPAGRMRPAGYVIMQHAERNRGRPARAYEHWMNRIPAVFASDVLGLPDDTDRFPPTPRSDPHCLALVRHYRSLAPLAQAAGKPIFRLRPADGALGSHAKAVQEAYMDFQRLAARIAEATWRRFHGDTTR